jgi:hypothetical protein
MRSRLGSEPAGIAPLRGTGIVNQTEYEKYATRQYHSLEPSYRWVMTPIFFNWDSFRFRRRLHWNILLSVTTILIVAIINLFFLPLATNWLLNLNCYYDTE